MSKENQESAYLFAFFATPNRYNSADTVLQYQIPKLSRLEVLGVGFRYEKVIHEVSPSLKECGFLWYDLIESKVNPCPSETV
jgi:hypothetical protein